MEKKNIKDLIVSRITTDMNENGMQISEETMAIIDSDMVIGASQRSLGAVRDWFNSKNVAKLSEKEQMKYVGAVVNLLYLIATNDVESLVKNWVLNGLQ